jgi:ABC-type sugar transport system substrate-binding protein
MLRIGSSAVLLAIATAALFGGSGCSTNGSTSGGPPPAAEPDEAPVIGIVAPFGTYTAVNVWIDDARMQEAPTRSVAKFYRMEQDDPPERQAELVRQAAADGCSALIVLPADPAALVATVSEVRKQVPVVVLDQAIPNGDGDGPNILVSFEDEVASAKKLVAAAIADAKEAGYPPDGPAIVLAQDFPDGRAKLRQKAIEDALKEKGVRVLPALKFVGFKDDSAKALKVALEVYGKIAMVFCDDDFALRGATEVRHLMDHKQPRFAVAGFVTDGELVELSRYNIVAGLVDRRIHDPMRTAFATALKLARGESVATDIRTPTPFFHKTGAEVEGFFPPYVGNPSLMLGRNQDAATVSKGAGRVIKDPPSPEAK